MASCICRLFCCKSARPVVGGVDAEPLIDGAGDVGNALQAYLVVRVEAGAFNVKDISAEVLKFEEGKRTAICGDAFKGLAAHCRSMYWRGIRNPRGIILYGRCFDGYGDRGEDVAVIDRFTRVLETRVLGELQLERHDRLCRDGGVTRLFPLWAQNCVGSFLPADSGEGITLAAAQNR